MNIVKRIQKILTDLEQATAHYNRASNSVHLLAVSKGQSITAIQEAVDAKQYHFGESYLQEALIKIEALKMLPLYWHFIGAIQRNKTKSIAQHFDWVHSLDRLDVARLLSAYRPQHLSPLNVCLQINLDNEMSKSGILPSQVNAIALEINQLPALKLRGLMAIPKPQIDEEIQYKSFMRLTELLNQLNDKFNLSLDTLSMGMSHDWVAAVRAGSTIVRVGEAIFGKRNK